jgi:hypothetical protein
MANDFAKDVRERWDAAERADHDNREEAVTDLKFAAGEQWDERVRAYREGTGDGPSAGPFPLPCLTINTIPQFVGQIVGDRRANQTSIKVLPREDGDVKIADVRSELIRSIELQSRADRVYANTFEAMVTCGLSNFRIDLDYAYDDAFERDLFIRAIPNPLAVQWDPFAGDPTARDAEWCFVSDMIPKDEFKRRFKDAKESSLDSADMKESGWINENGVRVSEYWTMTEKPVTIALMNDGKTLDISKMKEREYKGRLFLDQSGNPRIRETKCKYASMVLTNGFEELSDPFELKLHRIPIIRCSGREVWIGDKRVRFGLVRFARDPQQLKNFWRSVVAEMLLKAPRANFIAPAGAIAGRQSDWTDVLEYNPFDASGAPLPPPSAVTNSNLAAYINEAQMCSNDMKETTGIHEAELGMRSNETSGVAIRQRQQQGDLATIIYHDNMNAAMQEAGEVLNALIPIVYDTARTVRTVGSDDAVKLVRVNDPNADEHIDLSVGRYDVTVSTGPTYATRRQEAGAQMMELSSRAPQLLEVAGDLIVDTLDIPNGDKIAERVKRGMNPSILGDDANDNLTDEEKAQKQQAAQQAQQMQQMQAALAMRAATAETELKEAQTEEAKARAMLSAAQARQAMMGGDTGPDPVAIRKLEIDGYNAETNRIKAVTAKDFPLPPEATAILAPIVTQAVINALSSPDVLPAHVADHISKAALRDGVVDRAQADANVQGAIDAANQPDEPEGEIAA